MEYPLYEVGSRDFPGSLREIPDPPMRLYVRGTLPSREMKYLAVVGARRYSTYGRQVVETLLSGLRGFPIVIISGLALGIDMLAHRAALNAGLCALAVPGSGIDDRVLYPVRNRGLAHDILRAGGALVSEFEPTFRATTWSFPQRNRIMAGIADAVLVIEATRKSGTLITARLATDYNRDVLTVPGSIFSENSEGPHLLLSLGATPITSSADILSALSFSDTTTLAIPDFTKEEALIMELLHEPAPRDVLIHNSKMRPEEVSALIMMMELKGYIIEKNGYYTKRC